MPGVVFVPMQLTLLDLAHPTPVVPPSVDFSRLPWSDGRYDYNGGRPYLSLSVLNAPFSSNTCVLKPGIHLHWLLPGAYRRGFLGRHSPHRHRHPPAPDLWIVRRYTDDGDSEEWVVESDVLGPNMHAASASGSFVPSASGPGMPPYRSLGRTLSLRDWLQETASPPRHPGLTALGYGDPIFASHYPSCSSCFGFHDADAHRESGAVNYEVIGWRRESDQILLPWLIEHTAVGQRLSISELMSGKPGALGWKPVDLEGRPVGTVLDHRTMVLCYARTRFDRGRPRAPASGGCRVSLGANAIDAVVTDTVEQIRREGRTALDAGQLEEQLAHLGARDVTRRAKSDKYYRLLDARHRDSFIGVSGGVRWSLRSEPPQGVADAHATMMAAAQSVPAVFDAALQEINRLQADYDHARQRLGDLREQTFADWHRYQMAMYPGLVGDNTHGDVDEIRRFVERRSIAEVDTLALETGRVRVDIDNQGALDAVAVDADGRRAETLAQALRDLLHRIRRYSRTLIAGRFFGDIRTQFDSDGRGHLRFDSGSGHVRLDHIAGLGEARLRTGKPLIEFTVACRIRLAPGEGGVLLSFDATRWFEIAVPRSGADAGRVVFTTAHTDGSVDRQVGGHDVADGRWQRLTLGFSAAQSHKTIEVGGSGAADVEIVDGFGIGGVKDCSGCVGAATVCDEFTDEQRFEPDFVGDLTGLRMRIGPLDDRQRRALHEPAYLPRLTLRQTAAPRYWQPREPVVALVGDDATSSADDAPDERFPHHPLECTLVEGMPERMLLDADRPGRGRRRMVELILEIRYLLDGLQARWPRRFGFAETDGQSWKPVFADWDVALYPHAGHPVHSHGQGEFSPDFVTSTYWLERESTELELRPNQVGLARVASFLSGRSLVNPSAGGALKSRLDAFVEAHDDNAKLPAELDAAERILAREQARTLTFALDGFRAALLQKRQVAQLAIDDPLAFEAYRPFAPLVADAVGSRRTLAPDPTLHFNPIQSGALELRRLRLVDNFGRAREQPLDRVQRNVAAGVDGHPSLMTLPVRLAQPARLDFRWLGADEGTADASAAPADSPICGWFTVNGLDTVIHVHDATGHPLGMLVPERDSDSPLIWQAAPGAERPVAPAMFSNPVLRRVIEWLTRQGGAFIGVFAALLEHSLETIHPEDFGSDEWALLGGRPLALIRVRLDLVLKGLPAGDQGYGTFHRELHSGQRDSAGFDNVRFPVRLGDHRQVNDGLVGYWAEDARSRLQGHFHAPNAEAIDAARQVVPNGTPLRLSGGEQPPVVPLTLREPSRLLTLLIDPRGHVQATSGILPAKTITLPESFYQPALSRMRPSFFTGPILTAGDKLCLPLPRRHGLDWNWLERRRDVWRRVGQADIDQPAAALGASAAQAIREGWLELQPRDSGVPDD